MKFSTIHTVLFLILCVLGSTLAQNPPAEDKKLLSDQEREALRLKVKRFMDEFTDVRMLDDMMALRSSGRSGQIKDSLKDFSEYVNECLEISTFTTVNSDVFWVKALKQRKRYTANGRVATDEPAGLYTIDLHITIDTVSNKHEYTVKAITSANNTLRTLLHDNPKKLENLLKKLNNLFNDEFKGSKLIKPNKQVINDVVAKMFPILRKELTADILEKLSTSTEEFYRVMSRKHIREAAQLLDETILANKEKAVNGETGTYLIGNQINSIFSQEFVPYYNKGIERYKTSTNLPTLYVLGYNINYEIPADTLSAYTQRILRKSKEAKKNGVYLITLPYYKEKLYCAIDEVDNHKEQYINDNTEEVKAYLFKKIDDWTGNDFKLFSQKNADLATQAFNSSIRALERQAIKHTIKDDVITFDIKLDDITVTSKVSHGDIKDQTTLQTAMAFVGATEEELAMSGQLLEQSKMAYDEKYKELLEETRTENTIFNQHRNTIIDFVNSKDGSYRKWKNDGTQKGLEAIFTLLDIDFSRNDNTLTSSGLKEIVFSENSESHAISTIIPNLPEGTKYLMALCHKAGVRVLQKNNDEFELFYGTENVATIKDGYLTADWADQTKNTNTSTTSLGEIACKVNSNKRGRSTTSESESTWSSKVFFNPNEGNGVFGIISHQDIKQDLLVLKQKIIKKMSHLEGISFCYCEQVTESPQIPVLSSNLDPSLHMKFHTVLEETGNYGVKISCLLGTGHLEDTKVRDVFENINLRVDPKTQLEDNFDLRNTSPFLLIKGDNTVINNCSLSNKASFSLNTKLSSEIEANDYLIRQVGYCFQDNYPFNNPQLNLDYTFGNIGSNELFIDNYYYTLENGWFVLSNQTILDDDPIVIKNRGLSNETWYYRGAQARQQNKVLVYERFMYKLWQDARAGVIAKNNATREAILQMRLSQNIVYLIYELSPISGGIETYKQYSSGNMIMGSVLLGLTLLDLHEFKGGIAAFSESSQIGKIIKGGSRFKNSGIVKQGVGVGKELVLHSHTRLISSYTAREYLTSAIRKVEFIVNKHGFYSSQAQDAIGNVIAEIKRAHPHLYHDDLGRPIIYLDEIANGGVKLANAGGDWELVQKIRNKYPNEALPNGRSL